MVPERRGGSSLLARSLSVVDSMEEEGLFLLHFHTTTSHLKQVRQELNEAEGTEE